MREISVNWPVIVKQAGDAELIYIRDQQAWDNDSDLHVYDYDESDYLIDSSGHTFSLTHKIDSRVNPTSSGSKKTPVEILGLVKAHASQAGSCCVAKLYASSVNDAFEIVRSVNEA